FEREDPRPADFWAGRLRLVVSGGSQGARAINRAVVEALPLLASLPGGIEVVHQTGSADREWVEAAYRSAGVEARAEAFLPDMACVLRRAHLVVCRAGALTLAELQAVGAAALLIPFPHAAGGHQEANARHLAEAGAAEFLLESEASGERLAERVAALARERERLRALGERAKAFARPDAARRLAELCRELAQP
ncbi:MAG: glycosyltransferase, partial [Nitrospinota bacterium]